MIVGDNLESDPLQTYHCVGSLEALGYEAGSDRLTWRGFLVLARVAEPGADGDHAVGRGG